jgi:endoglucanase
MDLLEQLVNLEGVSGNEHSVRNFILKESRKYSKNVSVDKMGNIVVRKKGTRPRIVLLAHMDEVGLMVRSIDKKGKVFISEVGGVEPSILLAQRVYIKTQNKVKIRGVITSDQILNDEQIEDPLGIGELYVSTGLTKKELTAAGIKIGNYITFTEDCSFRTLGNKNIISGKALDDRIGCYILLELIKKLKTKNEVVFVFTVQEEVGLYGAKASVFNLEPDYAIAVDVTAHNDIDGTMVIGHGPSLTIKDAGMLGNKCLNEALESVAAKLKISLQLEVSDIGTTDATSVFAAKGGIPSAVLGVSVANLHSTIGISHRRDVEEVIKILNEFLKKPPAKCWA